MLPHIVEECTKFLWSDLSPKNACRAYEFAKLFEEPLLVEKSLNVSKIWAMIYENKNKNKASNDIFKFIFV